MNTAPTSIPGCTDPLEIRRTSDGSDTIWSENFREHYHSIHGAIQESAFIFIDNGLMALPACDEPVRVFEAGFGTGLNSLLTSLASLNLLLPLEYTAIEQFPLADSIWQRLNYPEVIGGDETAGLFRKLHQLHWNNTFRINPFFTLTKIQTDLLAWIPDRTGFDVVYFDAFSPSIQPEMWTVSQFGKMNHLLKPGGLLITYSCQGKVKQNLHQAGFSTEKLPGPPGKREILRAWKR